MRFLAPILLAQCILFGFLCYTLSISSDESCSLMTTDGSFGYMITQSIAFEWQPPGYFALLWLWRSVHPGPFWARLLSLLIASMATVAFFRMTKRIADESAQWPKWATVVFAFHPFTIASATDIRLYALGLLFSILQWDLFWRIYQRSEKGLIKWYVIVGILSLYTNVLLAFCLAAQCLVVCIYDRWSAVKSHVLVLCGIAGAYFPMFLYQLSLKTPIDTQSGSMTVKDSISFMVGSISFCMFPLPRVSETLLFRLVATFFVVVGLAYYWLRGRSNSSSVHSTIGKSTTYLLTVACLLGGFLFLADLMTSPRYMFPIVSICIVLLGLMIDDWRNALARKVAWLSILLVCVGSVSAYQYKLSKPGDVLRVSRELRTRVLASEVVLCFPSEMESMLRRYDCGHSQLVPVPDKQRLDRFLFSDFSIPNRESLSPTVEPALVDVDRCWVAYLDDAIDVAPDRLNRQFLDDLLLKSFELESSIAFDGATLCLFKRKSQP